MILLHDYCWVLTKKWEQKRCFGNYRCLVCNQLLNFFSLLQYPQRDPTNLHALWSMIHEIMNKRVLLRGCSTSFVTWGTNSQAYRWEIRLLLNQTPPNWWKDQTQSILGFLSRSSANQESSSIANKNYPQLASPSISFQFGIPRASSMETLNFPACEFARWNFGLYVG